MKVRPGNFYLLSKVAYKFLGFDGHHFNFETCARDITGVWKKGGITQWVSIPTMLRPILPPA